MAEKKANRDSVRDYSKKMSIMVTVRVPNPETCGVDYKAMINDYLMERYGATENGKQIKSLNEYILNLIEDDMNQWYGKEVIAIKKGLKDVKE